VFFSATLPGHGSEILMGLHLVQLVFRFLQLRTHCGESLSIATTIGKEKFFRIKALESRELETASS
jgi:hypothetical protein